ncbi:MAG: pyridoxamine 5'-phosphate oxidase family protein [Acidimicrobiales bacterium]
MSTWSTFEAAEPELAGRARALLTATTNCVLGTLRADGSPRLSGIDPFFVGGELHLGSMPGARKAHDLQRDPRLALHGVPWESRRPKEGAADPGEADAKLTGRAVEIPHDEAVRTMAAYFAERGIDAPAEGHLFRIELETVVVVFVEDDELVIDRWSEAEGRVTVRRS